MFHSAKSARPITSPGSAVRSLLVASAMALCALFANGLTVDASAATPGDAAAAQAAAVDAMGGAGALRSMTSFSYDATGTTWIFDEGLRPSDPPTVASTYRVRATQVHRAGDRDLVRLDWVRRSLDVDRPVREVLNGPVGYVSGVYRNGQPATTEGLTPDRWGAIGREQDLLNPHLLLRETLTEGRPFRDGGVRRIDGARHRVLILSDEVAPIRLFVRERDGALTQLVTTEHNYLRRDVPVRVRYSGWHSAGSGIRIPQRVNLIVDGRLMHRQLRTNLSVNRAFATARFALPASVAPRVNRRLAHRGRATSQWLNSFAQLGFVKDGAATEVTPVQVTPGVWLITGNPNQTAVVEQVDGIVVLEGALNSYRSEAIIGWIHARFPGKRIKAVHVGHHHADHSGGTRPYAALGATVYVHQSARSMFRGVVSDRSASVLPDRLDRAQTGRVPIVAIPPTGVVTIPDPVRPITFLAEPTTHATTTVLAHVGGGENVLFVNGDTCSLGGIAAGTAGNGCRTLNNLITATGLDIERLIGGHGPAVTFSQFIAAVG